MSEDICTWNSFWDLTTPEEAALMLYDLYGEAASQAAARCVVAAQSDGRDADCRFWIAVVLWLKGEGDTAANALARP